MKKQKKSYKRLIEIAEKLGWTILISLIIYGDEIYTERFGCDFKFDAVNNNDYTIKLKNIELELFVLQLQRDKKLNDLLR
jgi:hypothetical protein